MTVTDSGVLAALDHRNPQVRLRAALAAGTTPDPGYVTKLVERTAIEPEFFVREMLTWALIRNPAPATTGMLVAQLRAPGPQARSQALHTLSKLRDPQAWPAITRELLTDPDDEVARAAWRTAAVLVPDGSEPALVEVLMTQLGRGGRETQLSLSRVLISFGEMVEPALRAAAKHDDPRVRRHAEATERLLRDPDAGFEYSVGQVQRAMAPGAGEQQA